MPLRRAGTPVSSLRIPGPRLCSAPLRKSYALRCVRGTSCHRREERQWRTVRRLEHDFDLLPDLQRRELAIDEIRLQRWAFLKRDVTDRVRSGRRFAHQAEGI